MDISIQFHAAAEELLTFVERQIADLSVHIGALRFNPFSVETVKRSELADVLANTSVRRIVFSLEPPIPANDTMEFTDKNPNALVLDIGRLTSEGLFESWLSARTADRESVGAWKKVVRSLREMTTAGAVALNPKTGARAAAPRHRYTSRAQELQSRGVRMLGATGPRGAIMILGNG